MKIRFALLFTVCFFCTSVMAQEVTAPPPSGFLSDYTRLTPDAVSPDNYSHWIAPDLTGRKIGKIYFAPITPFPADAHFELVNKDTISQLCDGLDKILRKKLAKKETIVKTSEESDTTVEIAVTAAATVDAKMGALDFIPIRLLAKPLKDAALGKEQQIVITLEMRMRDAKTHQIIFEGLHRTEGKSIGRKGDEKLQADLKHLQPVIDDWTDKIIDEIISPRH